MAGEMIQNIAAYLKANPEAAQKAREYVKAHPDDVKTALKEIQTGKFARGWVKEYQTGYKKYNALLKKGEKHSIEKVGERLRGMMPWMKKRSVKGVQAAY